MKHFPTFSVDNFYDDPNSVREFALAQEFTASDEGRYPGKRTKSIYELNPKLFDTFCSRFFGIFYDFSNTKVEWAVETSFQLIEPYGDIPGINQGWIHKDHDSLCGGVIYLNPTSSNNVGTSTWQLKPGEEFDLDQNLKHKFNRGEVTDLEWYADELKKANDKFHNPVIFSNVYNRMIAFDGETYHKIDGFALDEPRLTQVFFIKEIVTNTTPLTRFKIDYQ